MAWSIELSQKLCGVFPSAMAEAKHKGEFFPWMKNKVFTSYYCTYAYNGHYGPLPLAIWFWKDIFCSDWFLGLILFGIIPILWAPKKALGQMAIYSTKQMLILHLRKISSSSVQGLHVVLVLRNALGFEVAHWYFLHAVLWKCLKIQLLSQSCKMNKCKKEFFRVYNFTQT